MEYMFDLVSLLVRLYVHMHMSLCKPGASIAKHEEIRSTLAVGNLASLRHHFSANAQPWPVHVHCVGVALVQMRTVDVFLMLRRSKNAENEFTIAFEVPEE